MVSLKEIVDLYDKRVLIPEFGEGARRRKLRSGLERTIDLVQSRELEFPVSAASRIPGNLANESIDYVAIQRIVEENSGYSRVIVRLRNALDNHNIIKYGDLFDFVQRRKSVKTGKRSLRRGAKRRRLGIYKLGIKCERVLYTHLAVVGIDLYGGGYKPDELLSIESMALLEKPL